MAKELLEKARSYEREQLYKAQGDRPLFHMTAIAGWINDPNGFAPYKGEYHLFFQYYPYDLKWGTMHWGHAKTEDFIRWEHLPCALAPDKEYDKDGCFSGGALELSDGRHLLMYTGVSSKINKDGKTETFQTQCIAFGDGENYEKYEANPVIAKDLLPEGSDAYDFRDPKIWHEDDKYYAVIGNRGPDKSGRILLYESRDAVKWSFVSVLAACNNQYGRMWECPDFFKLDNKHVLIVSPQEMSAVGPEFHPGNANVCLIGTFDKKLHVLDREAVQAVDYGLDFYAPQTLLTKDGRRVMIGWMQNWETSMHTLPDTSFMGQMTLPRELSVKNNRLYQMPVRELDAYRAERVYYSDIRINGEKCLDGIKGRYIDMTINVRPADENGLYKRFCIYVAKDTVHYTLISFDPGENTITVDRTCGGFPHDIVNVRAFPVNSQKGRLKLRLIMDRFSLELFVNDGMQAASFIIYTASDADGISFESDGEVAAEVEKYELRVSCFDH
ncbi:MAG: glycoside hydrolase family 32 protein [Lachnospiraceae bacterium]|nr:glycoside hydrolase family 32 protein [Lachnospiraceae bacterium]